MLLAVAACSGPRATTPVAEPAAAEIPARPGAASRAPSGAELDPPPASSDRAGTDEAGEGAGAVAAGYVDLPVPGFLPAVVFVPPGRGDARFPLAVVMHGAGGHPFPHCEQWRRLLRERAYLVCPRGTPWGHVPPGQEADGYFFREHRSLGREVVAAIDAASSALAPRLDPARAMYVGFSQGATMGALFLHELARDPARKDTFGRVALVEGGSAEWNVALSRQVHEHGVERLLLVCGQRSCSKDGEKSVGWMRKGGLDARFEDAPGAGHTWGGGVGERVVAALPWLVGGDARFSP
jgi:predicted esterase